MSEQSEFGRGYATCLRMFVNHKQRLASFLADYARFRITDPTLFSESHAVSLWASGATDHLYQLEIPSGLPPDEERMALYLQVRGLAIGHGYFSTGLLTTADEAHKLTTLAEYLLGALTGLGYSVATLDQAIETDTKLGLEPDEGSWSCPEDYPK